ncbi:dihydroorotase, multifunctional complex type [Eubacterium sp. 14-2]|uniref:dihydroorotase n=1 Tax=Eubacterium sp. 14-2 TaxID=1235790 RepID=UPI000338A66B|nr:dihydroorotase [Eubacterium sp. 14-2]EOT26563.1 dihydroorotase, multifunctional complex type [Eubacterium sp. 14-2]
MLLLIKNGTVINPGDKTEQKADVLVEDGIIKKIVSGQSVKADRVVDASDCYVMPGFIDMHVHLRDPGMEEKETVETGLKAAVHGGFTTVVAMPNTKPVVDNADVVNYVHNKGKNMGLAHVLQAGAVTKGQRGEALSDIEGMVEAGIPAISEDGKSVMNAQLYREAMTLAMKYDIPVLAHCEDINLVNGGVVNADETTEKMRLKGISNSVEDVIAARDIMLARETGAALHLCHCSTKDSVKMVEMARKEGIRVTAEVCPHHFILTSSDIRENDANYKMNPPLRTKEDVEALREGLKKDIMDVIATDHAPHTAIEKGMGIRRAPFGIVGLETAAALTMTELVDKGYLTVMQMAEKMSYNPAKILGLEKGVVEEGKEADLVVFHPGREYTINPDDFYSRGKNTPFAGKKVKGMVMATIVGGRVVYEK